MNLLRFILLLTLLTGGTYLIKPDLFKKIDSEITPPSTFPPEIIINQPENPLNVLGATAKRLTTSTKQKIEKIAGEQEEAIINQAVENISQQVKSIPEQQAKKIKYQFCQDIIQEELKKQRVGE